MANLSEMLTGNPRCDRCKSHHPEGFDCLAAVKAAFPPSVEGDRLEATNDQLHFAVSTFLARHKGNNGLEAMREATAPMFAALPCKGGEAMTRELAEARIATLRRDREWQARWMAGGKDERDLWKRLTDIASGQVAATPTTEPDTGRGLRELAQAILSAHNDLFCRGLPIYQGDRRIDHTKLNEAARLATQALAALSDTPRGRPTDG